MGGHHTGHWSNEDKKLDNLCPGQSKVEGCSLRRPKPPIRGGLVLEEEEDDCLLLQFHFSQLERIEQRHGLS